MKNRVVTVLSVIGLLALGAISLGPRLARLTTSHRVRRPQVVLFVERGLMSRVDPEGLVCMAEIDRLNSIAEASGEDKVPAEVWASAQEQCDRAAERAQKYHFTDWDKEAFRSVALRVRTRRPSRWTGEPKADVIPLEERNILSRIEPEGLDCVWKIDEANLAAKILGKDKMPVEAWDEAAVAERYRTLSKSSVPRLATTMTKWPASTSVPPPAQAPIGQGEEVAQA